MFTSQESLTVPSLALLGDSNSSGRTQKFLRKNPAMKPVCRVHSCSDRFTCFKNPEGVLTTECLNLDSGLLPQAYYWCCGSACWTGSGSALVVALVSVPPALDPQDNKCFRPRRRVRPPPQGCCSFKCNISVLKTIRWRKMLYH